MQAMFLACSFLSLVTRVNFAKEETKASLSVFRSKKPQILIESVKPSIQRAAICSSFVLSSSILKIAIKALHVFSNRGLIGPASSTVT